MEQITKLRKLLVQKKLDGYLVPMRDEFGSEYVPPQYRRLEYITNFTGSNGFAVILKNKAGFFTDGRYTLQAKKEVSSKIFELNDFAEKNEIDWLIKNTKPKSKIGFDPQVFSIAAIKKYQEKLDKKNIKLVEIENLVDVIWKEKSEYKTSKILKLENKYSGKSAKEKISEITKNLKADFLVLTNPESICWALNIRSHDIPSTPVLLCYAIISKKGEVIIYSLNNSKIDGIKNKKFAEFYKDLSALKNKSVQIDINSTPQSVLNSLKKQKAKIIEEKDPCIILRALKNKTEIKNIKTAHIKDGVALTKFFCWLEENINKNLDEYKIAEILENFRKENQNFLFPSFDTIAGYAENGAIIHYRARKENCKKLKTENILLLDSGGQYLEGTTDVTRTVALGKVSDEQKRNYTLVLKGHIAIASAKFPKGTSGAQIDALARIPLWKEYKDYKHGTGHGVGFCLNVHEGPHGISKHYTTPLEAGMVISNEPGFYKENAYGIRIENLVVVKESKNKNFFEFETLTQFPFDKNLIDTSILEKDEINWLNNYHELVYKNLSSYLSKKENTWIKKVTAKL